jgi:CheY-like chemotaxis protein
VAKDGAEAVRVAARGGIDLILMDCQMPVMDGSAATGAIRAMKSPLAELPIIAMTTNTRRRDVAACLGAGTNAHLSKPISHDALAAVFAQWGP